MKRAIIMTVAVAGAAAARVPERTAAGYLVPQPGARLEFPADHGSHPGYQIEWWYLTGHLRAEGGREFGFQATFFRIGGPHPGAPDDQSGFSTNELFSSHMALTDVTKARFRHDQRLDRAGWNAHAATGRLDLRHGPWSLRMPGPDEAMDLQFSVGPDALVRLRLTPRQPVVRFGEDGTSRKGAEPAARSYYLTFPRLHVAGTVELDGQAMPVTGEAWMDHEISSQQLGSDLIGWDWTAIQLHDGRELKAYLLRRRDGTPSEFSRLIWVRQDGTVVYHPLGPAFSWQKTGWWTSKTSGTRYPTTVEIRTIDPDSNQPLALRLLPKLPDQELTDPLGGVTYWEGACKVEDASRQSLGQAYLELVGYGTTPARNP